MLPGDGVDFVYDLEEPLPAAWQGWFSHVDCCSVLEHTQRPWVVAKTIEDCLVRGGTLLLSVPFVWRVHGYPSDYWRITTSALPVLFPRMRWLFSRYLVDGRFRKLSPGGRFENGDLWMARSEVVAFGVKHED